MREFSGPARFKAASLSFLRKRDPEPSRDYAAAILTEFIFRAKAWGGRGVFEVTYWTAHRFAAAVALCAFGIPNIAGCLKRLPIWMFHGDRDEILPVARGREMFAALQAESDLARLTILEGRGHSIGREVDADGLLWEWLFAQRRSATR
jgi:pimeloyl-ACP methyl ester carboxylesterase